MILHFSRRTGDHFGSSVILMECSFGGHQLGCFNYLQNIGLWDARILPICLLKIWGVSIDSWPDKAWLCAAMARLSAWQCEVRVRPGQRDDRCWTGWRWAPEVCIKSGWWRVFLACFSGVFPWTLLDLDNFESSCELLTELGERWEVSLSNKKLKVFHRVSRSVNWVQAETLDHVGSTPPRSHHRAYYIFSRQSL